MDFYLILEKLLIRLNNIDEPDMDYIRDSIGDFCKLMNIAKVEMFFYENAKLESLGKGECICCYDTGEECTESYKKRSFNSVIGITVYKLYRTACSEEWTDEEIKRIRLVFKTVLVYINRIWMSQAVEKLTYYDSDNYPNLRYFYRYAEQCAHDGEITQKVAIHFNLRHFSLVNQQVGRKAGNLVMRNYFKGLQVLVGRSGVVCRVGGDNFALFCAKSLLKRVLEYLNETAVVYDVNSGDRVKVYTSVGIFEIPDDFAYNDYGDVMDKIIFASQMARRSDRNNVVFYDENMVANKDKIIQIQQMFPEAIENEEYKVYYQPKIDIHNGELVGAEALCRWERDGKLIPPGDFISVLEQGMEICKLDFYMLDHVCRDIRRWLDEEKNVVRISVNLSRKHMVDVDLLEHILEIVDRNNVPHKYIEIELTETTTDVEFRDLKRVVNGLQDVGICTSVDDFGMGYSSLNLIKEVPWDVLKVDRSFLPLDEDNENSIRSVMFKYVVAMAKEMGLECIAEGVETKSQINILKENNCDLAQGFFFDRPLPLDVFEDRLKVHKYTI